MTDTIEVSAKEALSYADWTWFERTEIRKARIEHKCSARCGEAIEPGTEYLRVILAYPWDQEADVDDEGRTITGGKFGEWSAAKYHPACFARHFREDY